MTSAVPGAARHRIVADAVVPPAPSTLDLHTHTARSDGLLTPQALVSTAAAAGVRLLAITDHDTLAGVRELHAENAVPAGLELLCGVEINAVVRDRPELVESEVHVLGLGVDPDDDELEAALARQRSARRIRFEKMVTKLAGLGFAVGGALEAQPSTDDDDALGRPRLARALIALGAATSVEDAFERWLSRGRPAYVPREGLGPIEAIRAIRRSGGLASLAHFSEAPRLRDIVIELADAGLGGLEVYYRAFDRPTVDAVGGVARELRLVATGGSDYHGDRETYAEAHAALWVPPSVEAPLREALAAAAAARVAA
ncbi:MAG TPA: PHP domain-containing protein [Candidatus Limnocylindrales bacterium]|nr:PHP domain-containing protein [Candidatus Limnocylindrales bacterium]